MQRGTARCGRTAGAGGGPGALPSSCSGNENRLAVLRSGLGAERRASRAGRGGGEGTAAGHRSGQQEARCHEPGADLAQPSHQSHGSHASAFAAGDPSSFLIRVHTATTGPFGEKALYSERTVVSLHSRLLHTTDDQDARNAMRADVAFPLAALPG